MASEGGVRRRRSTPASSATPCGRSLQFVDDPVAARRRAGQQDRAPAVTAEAAAAYLRWADHPLLGPGAPFELVERDGTRRADDGVRHPAALDPRAAGGGVRLRRPRRRSSSPTARSRSTSCAGGCRPSPPRCAIEHGVGPGAHVGLVAANSPEWILTYLAVTSLGGVVVAFNGWWTGAEIAYGVELTDPQLLVVDRRRAERMAGLPRRPCRRSSSTTSSPALEQYAPDASTPRGRHRPRRPGRRCCSRAAPPAGRRGRSSRTAGMLMLVTSTAFTATRTVAERPQTASATSRPPSCSCPCSTCRACRRCTTRSASASARSGRSGRFDEEQVLRVHRAPPGDGLVADGDPDLADPRARGVRPVRARQPVVRRRRGLDVGARADPPRAQPAAACRGGDDLRVRPDRDRRGWAPSTPAPP